ncbi:hypothetical protein OAO39_02105 [Pirellulaceae bacterium]|nr:hypothetical protein [Pirellulaceae bacterium]
MVELEVLGKAGNGTVVISDGKQQTRLPLSELNVGTNVIKLQQPTSDTRIRISIDVDAVIGVGYVVYSSITVK